MKKNTTKNVDAHGNGNNNESTQIVYSKGCKQDVNLRKNGVVNFQIGLILALVFVFIGLEATFRLKDQLNPEPPNLVNPLLEYYPDLQNVVVERPKNTDVAQHQKVLNPPEFTIVPDDTDTGKERAFIQIPPDTEGASLDVGSLHVPDDSIIEDIPIHLVEDVPVFPGCEGVAKEDRITCFQEKMQLHIKKNFKYPEAEQGLGIQGRVAVMFKIDVDGSIKDIQLKGPSKGLEMEAQRIISKLPKMTPGKQSGRPVRVPFYIPINFQLQK